MNVCFPTTKDLAPIITKRLVELGYEKSDGFVEAAADAGYIRTDKGVQLAHGSVRYPTPIAVWSWGSLNDLFFTEMYRIKKPIALGLGIGVVHVSDHVAFGCKKVTLEEVDMIVAAIAKYKKGDA